MAQVKLPLETLLAQSAGKKFLFLGREGIFTKQECERYLKNYDITMTKYYEEGVVGVVEHHTLNPIEEDISCAAYDDSVPLYTLIDFEKILSEGIDDDELLMGIKLANDQERVKRLIGNAHISDTLFVKLLALYTWHEDEEDNTKDRDVIMATLRRYINIKPNEEDLLYTYLTLRRLATEATDPRLLQALIGFPNYSFLIRGKQKITLRETIAKNESIDKDVITKLISLRDVEVDAAMACNATLSLVLLQTFAKKNITSVDESLATNTNIDEDIFEKLLLKGQSVVQLLLWWQPMNMKRLILVDACQLPSDIFATIGANERLSEEVIFELIKRENIDLLSHLSANETLSALNLENIYNRQIPQTYKYLAANASLPIYIIEEFYKMHASEKDIIIALASNPSASEVMLRALFERDDFEVNKGLACNASVPLELLNILKIDTRLRNELTANTAFVASITKTLGL